MKTTLVLTVTESVDALPAGATALFPADPLANAAWYRTASAHALSGGATPYFAMLSRNGQPCALAPLLRQADGGLASLTTPYSCVHWPLLVGDADPSSVQEAGRQFGAFYRTWPTIRLDAVPAEWLALAPFLAGLRQAGLQVQVFEHFGNWHEPVQGRSWAAYLASRQGALRETVRRKLKRGGQARFELVTSERLDHGIAAFEAVYRASWKKPEPFPRFNAALMRAAAEQGALRLGVLWAGDRPAAAPLLLGAAGRGAGRRDGDEDGDAGFPDEGMGLPALRFGFFGQMSPLKGITVLMEAARRLTELRIRNVVIEIYGDYSSQPIEFQKVVEEALEEAGENVVFHGAYDNAQVNALMARIDAMIIPSTWWENSPVVIQEAFTNGKPVICSNIGGMAEKITHGVNGLHFEVSRPASLAEVLADLATNPEKLAALTAGVRPPPTAQEVLDQHLELYDRVLTV